MISSGFPILGGPGSRRFCRPICAAGSARKQLMIVLCRAGSSMRCAVAVAGPSKTLCNRFVRRAGRGYGKVSSALRQALRIRLTGCSSTAPASGFIAAPAAEKGGLGPYAPWYRPHQRRTQHRAPRRPRPQGPPRVFVNCVLLPTPGNVHDCKVAQHCIEAMLPSAERVAGKGHDGLELRKWLEERGTGAVIPQRKNRRIRYHDDRAVYRERNIIERMFCRLKDRRRIATRFERNIKTSCQLSRAAALVSWL